MGACSRCQSVGDQELREPGIKFAGFFSLCIAFFLISVRGDLFMPGSFYFERGELSFV